MFFALFVCVASPLPAGPLPATGVLDALAEPDGSAVSLKAVSVQKTASDPPHIVVSDPCHDASPTPSEPPAASYRRNNGLATVVLATDDDGEVEATLSVPSQFTCPGTVTVTASTSAAPCSEQHTDSNVVRVLCQQPAGVDVFFCIDWTDSMSENWPKVAIQSLCSSLESALGAQSIAVRFGGLRFNDEAGINPAQVRSLSLGLNAAGFAEFLDLPYDAANGYEMQWKCLDMAAQDCLSNGSSSRLPFIVMVTDEDVNVEAGYTRSGILQELQASGIPVFFSIWEAWPCATDVHDFYEGINVNGGKFDPVDYDYALRVPLSEANMYPFRLLKAAIAGVEDE